MFKALNTLSSSSSDEASSSESSAEESENENEVDSFETKHNQIKKNYQEALKCYATSDIIAAKRLLEQLANDDIFQNLDKLSRCMKSDLKQLQFAVFKNLAAIFADENDHNNAVDFYLKAAEICDSDVVLLYRLGAEACKTENFRLARSAFEQGLHISPDHWMCLDKLIAVTFVLGDYANCLIHIKTALTKNPHYSRGLVLKDEIFNRNPCLQSFAKFDDMNLAKYSTEESKKMLEKLNEYADRMLERGQPKPKPAIKPKCKLNALNWSSLAEALWNTYDEFYTSHMLNRFVDLSEWLTVIPVSNENDESEAVSFHPAKIAKEIVPPVELSQNGVCSSLLFQHSGVVDNTFLDTTMDSVVSESDNEGKSVTTSGGEAGFDENLSLFSSPVVPGSGFSDLDSPKAPVVNSSPGRRGRGRGRKRKATDSPGRVGFSAEAKRRSSRLIPGFYMEDPEAFGPYTTKTVSLKDQLYSYLPEKLISLASTGSWPHSGSCTPRSEARISTDSSENKLENEFLNCGHLKVENGCDEDVVDFIKSFNEFCIIEILWHFLRRFCNAWSKRLSPTFCRAYSNCCRRWTKHVDYAMPSSDSQSIDFLRDVALVRLFSAELELVFFPIEEIQRDATSPTLYYYFSEISSFRQTFGPEWSTFGCRAAYYQAKRSDLLKSFDFAQSYLEKCVFWLTLIDGVQRVVLLLPNSNDKICKSVVEKKLETLDRRSMLNSIGLLYDQGEYRSIIDLLSVTIETESSATDFANVKERFERRALLAKSYLALKDFPSLSTCVVDVLYICMEVYRRLDYVDKYDWWQNFDLVLKWSLLCLQQREPVDESRSLLLACCSLSCLKTLAETLIEIILCTLDFTGTGQRQKGAVPAACYVNSWIILYDLCKFLETESLDEDAYVKSWYATSDSHNVVLTTKSLMVLDKAHEELGKKGLCMIDDGRLLLMLSEELMKSLRHPKISKYLTSSVNDDSLNCAEQCFYCLYNYPRKRNRCIVEHNATNIPLTFEMSSIVFDFVRPEKSPEFDDTSPGISSETVHLLHRIESLVPESLKLDSILPHMEEAINGTREDLPRNDVCDEETPIVRDLYHLLGDYYGKVKDKDLEKVCRYYTMDLCLSPDRGDSWAGLAIHKGTVVDQALNSLDLKYDMEDLGRVTRLAASALFCYRQVEFRMPGHAVLLVEHGSLAYSLQSYIRRFAKNIILMKNETIIDASTKKMIEAYHGDYLHEAKNAFESASLVFRKPQNNAVDGYKEEWVLYYLLGKIAEKMNDAPSAVLPYYHRAAYCLHSDGAKYPVRLLYNAGGNAYEALEIFYRIHASALKWLKGGRLSDENELLTVWKYLRMYCSSPFKVQDQQTQHGRLSAVAVEKRGFSRCPIFIDPDVVQTVEDLLSEIKAMEFAENNKTGQLGFPDEMSTVVENLLYKTEGMSQQDMRKQIVQYSMDAMQICVRRCPHSPHYKSYHWLALSYFENPVVKDRDRSRRCLIGPTNVVQTHALFQHFKEQNLFEGIWVIPTDDISRSGSLAAHLHKTVRLLNRILIALGSYEHLFDLYSFLIKKPTTQKSTYLKECDRLQLVPLVLDSVEKVVKTHFNKNVQAPYALEDICIKAYLCYTDIHRLITNDSSKTRWSEIFTWLYEKMYNRKISNIDEALSQFQQLLHKNRPSVVNAPRKRAQVLDTVRNRSPNVYTLQQHRPQRPLPPQQRFQAEPMMTSSSGVGVVRQQQRPLFVAGTEKVTPRPPNPVVLPAAQYRNTPKSPDVVTLKDSSPESSPNGDVTVLKVVEGFGRKNVTTSKKVLFPLSTASFVSSAPRLSISTAKVPQSGTPRLSNSTVRNMLALKRNDFSLQQHQQRANNLSLSRTQQQPDRSYGSSIRTLNPTTHLTGSVSYSHMRPIDNSVISAALNLSLQNGGNAMRQKFPKKSTPG